MNRYQTNHSKPNIV